MSLARGRVEAQLPAMDLGVPSADGLEIHFVPYQFGIALPETKVIPWAALADLITPGMAGITQS